MWAGSSRPTHQWGTLGVLGVVVGTVAVILLQQGGASESIGVPKYRQKSSEEGWNLHNRPEEGPPQAGNRPSLAGKERGNTREDELAARGSEDAQRTEIENSKANTSMANSDSEADKSSEEARERDGEWDPTHRGWAQGMEQDKPVNRLSLLTGKIPD